MNSLIELTDSEQIAAVGALRSVAKSKITDDDYGLLAAAINAVNKIRTGDPIGTIRRNANGDVAVRTNYRNSPGHRGWRVYTHHYLAQDQRKSPMTTESWIGPAGDCDWPIIYQPEVTE